VKIKIFLLSILVCVFSFSVSASSRSSFYEALLSEDFEKAYSFAHKDFQKSVSKEFFTSALKGWKLVEFKKLKSSMFGNEWAYDVIYSSVERDNVVLSDFEVVFWIKEDGREKFVNFPFPESAIPSIPIKIDISGQ